MKLQNLNHSLTVDTFTFWQRSANRSGVQYSTYCSECLPAERHFTDRERFMQTHLLHQIQSSTPTGTKRYRFNCVDWKKGGNNSLSLNFHLTPSSNLSWIRPEPTKQHSKHKHSNWCWIHLRQVITDCFVQAQELLYCLFLLKILIEGKSRIIFFRGKKNNPKQLLAPLWRGNYVRGGHANLSSTLDKQIIW